MKKPMFITITDFNKNTYDININHIFQITEQENWKKIKITTVSYYMIPDCKSILENIIHLKTPESKKSILDRLEELKSNRE